MTSAHWEEAEFAAAIERLRTKGVIDARGRQIIDQQFELILSTAPRADERPVFEQACFDGATFKGPAEFDGATFEDVARFDGATFEGEARFEKATFGEVSLNGAVFDRRVTLDIRAEYLSAARAEFRAGTDILAESAAITFRDATFAAPSTLGPVPGDDPSGTIPRVFSLRGARVVDLALSGVDLRTCHFRGAHGLETLRLEQVLLAEPPRWTKAKRWPFLILWTRRVAIAEERWWRAGQRFRWKKPAWPSSREPSLREGEPPPPKPHQIAAIYRSLRKGREDNKDSPGAADFYYGEMEMRRHSKYKDDEALGSEPPYKAPSLKRWANYDNTRRTPYAEKFVLWLYWAVSGYALRASRALACLLVTIAVFGVGFWFVGFDCPEPPTECQATLGRGLLLSAESSSSLFRAPDQTRYVLGDVGEVMQLAIRLLGPLFFGLALLSLRGRVKR